MSVSAAVAGSIASGLISSAGQYVANQQMIENQNKWNDVSIHLADTAHQREVNDLLAAGINPILTASGSGSAVPSLGTAQVGNVGEGISSGMNSAARVLNPLVQSQVDVNSAQAANLRADGELKKAQAALVLQGKESSKDLLDNAVDFIESGGDKVGQMISSAKDFKSTMKLPEDLKTFYSDTDTRIQGPDGRWCTFSQLRHKLGDDKAIDYAADYLRRHKPTQGF